MNERVDLERRPLLKVIGASPLAAATAGALTGTVGSLLNPGAAGAAGEPPAKGQLVWSDDFASLDPSRWRVAPDGWQDRYGDVVGWDPGLVSVDNSILRLRVQQRPDGWWGGLVHTRERAAWTYGYFEIRAKVPAGHGLWSALWMMPSANAYGYWPLSGEIDILEHLGRAEECGNGYTTLHYTSDGGNHGQTYCVAKATDWTTTWHTWGCQWNKASDGRVYMQFYADDQWYGSFDDSQWPPAPSGGGGSPFDQAFYFVLNLTVGGAWAQQPEQSADGKSLDIDSVNVYRLSA